MIFEEWVKSQPEYSFFSDDLLAVMERTWKAALKNQWQPMRNSEFLQDPWRTIDTAPFCEWVFMHSPQYKDGPGVEKKGIMLGYIDVYGNYFDETGIKVKWVFTHWMPLPKPPL